MKEVFFEYLDSIQLFFQNIINNILEFDYSWFFVDYFSNFWFEDFLKLVLIYLFILWVAIVIWVTRDILSRSNSIIMQLFSILLVVFLTPIFWLIIYFIIRPSKKTIDEDDYYEEVVEEVVDEDELKKQEKKCDKKEDEEEILEKEVKKEELKNELEKITCYNCNFHIEENFKFCPNCEIKLKDNCKKCNEVIRTNWKICPYCWEKNEKKVIVIEPEKKQEKKEKKISFLEKIFFETKEETPEEKKVILPEKTKKEKRKEFKEKLDFKKYLENSQEKK